MLIDTHCHINFKEFKNDYKNIVDRARQQDVQMILVGTQKDTSADAIVMAQETEQWAAVGLHPIQSHEEREIKEEHSHFKSRAEIFDPAVYYDMAIQPSVVAVGECGLDYYHIGAGEDREAIKLAQKKLFDDHIDVANQAEKPLIIHCRGSNSLPQDALLDLLVQLKNHLPKHRGVLHSFAGDWNMAEEFLALGFCLGFNGIITFDKTGRTGDVIRKAPLDRLLVETDAPYLTPVPFRGEKNEPVHVIHVARFMAELKGLTFTEVAETTTQTAQELFQLEF